MAIAANGQPTYFPQIPQANYNKAFVMVLAAQAAWSGMVQQFAAENLACGITNAQAVLIGSAMMQVSTYGAQGQLWLAYNALSSVIVTPQMSPFLTAARIQWMKNTMIDAIAALPS